MRGAGEVADPPDIGRRMKLFRVEGGRKLKEVAAAAGMQPSQLSRIEGCKTDPKWTTVERIAKALEVDVSDLVSKDEPV